MASKFQERYALPSESSKLDSNKFSSSMGDAYQSLELRPGARTIRILHLLPLSTIEKGQQLQGTLQVYKLSLGYGQEQFEALSYVWVTEEHIDNRPVIRCNGCDIPITDNCRDALTQLSPKDGYRSIWVDSICINQKDMEERSQQVAMMLDIYSKAKTVLIWLHTEGVTDVETQCAIRSIHAAKSRHVEEDFERTQDALSFLLSRSWFSRGWTFQELILGSNPVFLTIQDELPWHEVSHLVLRYASKIHAQPSLGRFLSLIRLWSTVNTRNRMRLTLMESSTYVMALGLYLSSAKYFCQRHLFMSPQNGRPSFLAIIRDIIFYLLFGFSAAMQIQEAPPWIISGSLRMMYPLGSTLKAMIVLGALPACRFSPGLQIPFPWPRGCPRRQIFILLVLWIAKRLGKGYFVRQCRAFIDAAYVVMVVPRTVYAHYRRRDLHSLSYLYSRNRQLECAGLMEALRTRQVLNMKDKAYAMYGILKTIGVCTKRADYSTSCQEIYLDLFLSLISWRATMLALLIHAGKVSSKVHDMPSWVPDWRTDTNSAWLPEDVLRRCTSKSVYTSVRECGLPFYFIDRKELTVLGRQLDIVASVVQLPHTALSYPDPAALDAISQWLALVRGIRRETEALDLLHLLKQDLRGGGISLPHRANSRPSYRDLDTNAIQVNLQRRICGKRLLFVTKNGRYGTGSLKIQEGDTVHLISGVPTPLCLRRQASGDRYEISGPAIMSHDSSDGIWQERMKRIVLV
ncbi:unnamed protein product [Alternaria alternata]